MITSRLVGAVAALLLSAGPVMAVGHENDSAPEFDPAVAGIIGAILAGGGLLLVRRRRR